MSRVSVIPSKPHFLLFVIAGRGDVRLMIRQPLQSQSLGLELFITRSARRTGPRRTQTRRGPRTGSAGRHRAIRRLRPGAPSPGGAELETPADGDRAGRGYGTDQSPPPTGIAAIERTRRAQVRRTMSPPGTRSSSDVTGPTHRPAPASGLGTNGSRTAANTARRPSLYAAVLSPPSCTVDMSRAR